MIQVPRLSVSDLQGRRSVSVDKPVFTIGRRATADLQVAGQDVSRDHAKITQNGDHYVLADCGSRFGTFLNGEQLIGEDAHARRQGSLGQTDAVELVFMAEEDGLTRFRSSGSSLRICRRWPPF